VVWKNAQMRKNMFLTTSDVQKYFFKELDSGGLEVCTNASKYVLNNFRHKNIFFKNFILVVWKYAQMYKNRFLTTSDIKKYLF
jgi:hypothetical protein